MSNQTAAALSAIGTSVNWGKKGLDLQAIIEAGNQGLLGGPLTSWLMNKGWMKSTLTTHNVFKDKEAYLEGPEFIRRAKQISGWETGDQKAYEYYKDQAHWAEIPKDVDVLVFINTDFGSGGNRCVRFLYRFGSKWYGSCRWIVNGFYSHCRVAVLTSPLDSGTVAS